MRILMAVLWIYSKSIKSSTRPELSIRKIDGRMVGLTDHQWIYVMTTIRMKDQILRMQGKC